MPLEYLDLLVPVPQPVLNLLKIAPGNAQRFVSELRPDNQAQALVAVGVLYTREPQETPVQRQDVVLKAAHSGHCLAQTGHTSGAL